MDGIKELCESWHESGSAVVLTGAGASTESGLLDFTGEGSEYGGASARELLTREFMLRDPGVFQEYCRNRLYSGFARPNIFHTSLAQWEKSGLVSAIITQNIDRLHQQAGSVNVIELHGNMLRVYCDECKRDASAETYFMRDARIRYCPHCRGIIRPDIILYGEKLDSSVLDSALKLIDNVPMLIVAGTRMKVTAPLDIVERFQRHPGVCVYIGDTPPAMCNFDILIEGRIGDITTELRKVMY